MALKTAAIKDLPSILLSEITAGLKLLNEKYLCVFILETVHE